jgi:hypothetical protein
VTAYDDAIASMARGCYVVCVPGIDPDGNPKVVTVAWNTTPIATRYLHTDDAVIRVGFLLGATIAGHAAAHRRGIETLA